MTIGRRAVSGRLKTNYPIFDIAAVDVVERFAWPSTAFRAPPRNRAIGRGNCTCASRSLKFARKGLDQRPGENGIGFDILNLANKAA